MFSRKKVRLVFTFASVALLTLVSATSDAGRSVRSDASDNAFEFLGGFWGDNTEQFGGPGQSVRTQFKLNFNPSSGARYYTVCMSEDGFIRLVTAATCADSDYALPPARPYIAVFATDIDSTASFFGSLIYARGFVDTNTPYRLPEAVPAMRFWWSGMLLAGDSDTSHAFDVQIVLLDRSKGKNNGDFDIEFNYGNGEQVPPVGTESNPNAAGFQGFKLGPNSRGPVLGPFGPFDATGAPIRFCFRAGLRTSC